MRTQTTGREDTDMGGSNPVEAGFVNDPWQWRYISAVDDSAGKGLLALADFSILNTPAPAIWSALLD